MDDRWLGNEFQIFEATDEKDLEAAMVVLRGGNTYRQNWSRAECSCWYIFWDERCKIGWLLKLEYPKSNRSDFKGNSVANRKPMQIRKNRRNVAEPRFLCDNSSESILNMLKASEIWNGCTSQERVAIIKSRADYCYRYGFRSLFSKRSTDVTQCTNMEKTSLTCFRHLLIKGHFWVKVNTKILNWCLKLNRRASNRDRSNRLSQSRKRFGSGVVKGDGLWLGWVQMKTVIQKLVVLPSKVPEICSRSQWFLYSDSSSTSFNHDLVLFKFTNLTSWACMSECSPMWDLFIPISSIDPVKAGYAWLEQRYL